MSDFDKLRDSIELLKSTLKASIETETELINKIENHLIDQNRLLSDLNRLLRQDPQDDLESIPFKEMYWR